MYTEKIIKDSELNKQIKNYLKYLKIKGSANHNSQLDCSICKKFFNTSNVQTQNIYNTIIKEDFSVQVKLRSDPTITFDNYKKLKNNEKKPGWVDYLKTDYALFVYADDDGKSIICKSIPKDDLKNYLHICRNWKNESEENKKIITNTFVETSFDSNSLYFRLTPKKV